MQGAGLATSEAPTPPAPLPRRDGPPRAEQPGTPDTVVSVHLDGDLPAAPQVAEVAEAAARSDGEVRIVDKASDVVSVALPPETAAAGTESLASLPSVTEVTATPELFRMRRPNDDLWSKQAPYLRDIRLNRAWNHTRGSRRVVVAVIDDGLDRRHRDLSRKVVRVRNVVERNRNVRSVGMGHGTMVAGVAAAATNNRKGIAGVGWRTRLMAVRVDDRKGRIYADAVSRGIRWAVRRGADVINISLGGHIGSQQLQDAVDFADRRGVLVVAAAGNYGTRRMVYPAAYDSVLAVGATNRKNRRAPFSSFGQWVDVSAPGTGIVTTRKGGKYGRVSGTSFAAPIVVGQAALLMGLHPTADHRQVRAAIERSTANLALNAAEHGRIDIRSSVRRLNRIMRGGVPTPEPEPESEPEPEPTPRPTAYAGE
jgi:subtilisin family serine protease